MSTPRDRHPQIDPAFVENPAKDPGDAVPSPPATDHFVHGLLASLHHDSIAERERRMARLMAAVNAEGGGGQPLRIRVVLPWRIASGLAAAILITGLVILGVPAQSATAMVQSSLAASKTAGDRRYEVRAMLPQQTALESEPMAVLDVRDTDHVLIRAKSPFGDEVVLGRDALGSWAIRPDGTVDRDPPRGPRWVNFGQSTVLLGSVDDLLKWLGDSYELRRSTAEPLPSTAADRASPTGPKYDRVIATHKPGRLAEPQRVELWIDQQSHLVRRMELTWPPRPGLGGPGRPGGPGPGGPDRPGFGPDRRPRPLMGDEDGLPDQPPPRMDDEDRPGRPGPDGEDRPRRRPPPPRGDEGPDAPRPPLGKGDRPGPPPPPPPPRPHHPPPEFMGGPPDFDAPHRPPPPPPRRLVFDLVEGQQFAPDWFDPATHSHP